MRFLTAMCALALSSTPAFAGPAAGKAERLERHIELSDLDLASAAGARALRDRVSVAVDLLCSEATGADHGSADFKFATMRCRKSALGQARSQVAQLLAASGDPRGKPAGVAVAVRVSGVPAR